MTTKDQNIIDLLNTKNLQNVLSQIEPAQNLDNNILSLNSTLSQNHLETNFLEQFSILHELTFLDVFHSTERLKSLNSSRKQLIEKRINIIAKSYGLLEGVKLRKTIGFDEIFKVSLKQKNETIVSQAFQAFCHEVVLYNTFELFLLKALSFYHIREFSLNDLENLNFALHTFLTNHAVAFGSDKHAWNFTKNNVYSWYCPSQNLVSKAKEILSEFNQNYPISWSDYDLRTWYQFIIKKENLIHLDNKQDEAITTALVEYLKENLEFDFFQSKTKLDKVPCKIFIPSFDKSSLPVKILNEIQFTPNSVWFCQNDPFELFTTEMRSILRFITHQKQDTAFVCNENFKIPRIIKSTQNLALELHKRDQLDFYSTSHQGTALQILENDFFDHSFVLNSPVHEKSNAWLTALIQQLPYWKQFFINPKITNWGELHLLLAATKTKPQGYCFYLTYQEFEDSKESTPLRKNIFNLLSLEQKINIQTEDKNLTLPYTTLYIFKRKNSEIDKDYSKPYFGDVILNLDTELHSKSKFIMPKPLTQSLSSNSRIANLGWKEITKNSETPILKKLEKKFPKLKTLAKIYQSLKNQENENNKTLGESFNDLFKLTLSLQDGELLVFDKLNSKLQHNCNYGFNLYFTNEIDQKTCKYLLKSKLLNQWIQTKLDLENPNSISIDEVANIPVIDTKNTSQELIKKESEILNRILDNHEQLKNWAQESKEESHLISKFIAVILKKDTVQNQIEKYKPLFENHIFHFESVGQLKLEALIHLYPKVLMQPLEECLANKKSQISISYYGKELTPIPSSEWVLSTVQTFKSNHQYIIALNMAQGPCIKLSTTDFELAPYIVCQISHLIGYSFQEILNQVYIPKDFNLFKAHTLEIENLIQNTFNRNEVLNNLIDILVNKIFDIENSFSLETLH